MTDDRTLTLCADDFALDTGTSEGILRLAATRRISAVSCLTEAPLWPEYGRKLAALPGHVAIGLHFNLTECWGGNRPPLFAWIFRSLVNRIDAAEIRNALESQWTAFCDVIGRRPDFLDGHQHVHALPVIRDLVADFLCAGQEQKPETTVRCVDQFFGSTDAPLKRFAIRRLARYHRTADSARVRPQNSAFGGDYSLTTRVDYPRLFADWVRQAPSRALIVCHPACPDTDGLKPRSFRENEFEFLAGEDMPDILAKNRVQLD